MYNRSEAGVYTMMQKLAYKARLTYQTATDRGRHTATPCLPTIPAEGIPNLIVVEHYLHVRQPVATGMYVVVSQC
jgi:hypothetical protein